MTSICIISSFPPEEDGLAPYTVRFAQALLDITKFSVVVICKSRSSKEPRLDCGEGDNLKVLRIWKPESLINQLRLWRAIVHLHPDVVDVQYGPYNKYGGLIGEPLLALILLLRLSGLRTVLTMHSIWLPEEAAERAFERTHKKLLSIIAGIYYWTFMLLFLRLPSRILLVVSFERSQITEDVKTMFHLPSQKLREVVHGTLPPLRDTTQKSCFKRRLRLWGKKVFLIFGFLRRDKGIELALRSMNSLRGRNVLIVAGKPLTKEDKRYLSRLRTLVEQLELSDHVRFDTRFVPEEDLVGYLNAADVLLLPYERRVGPSGPLATAASYGLPAIAVYDRKWLVNGDSFAYLLKKADHKELLDAMIRIKNNEATMIKNAIDYAYKHRFENIAEQYKSLVMDS